MDEKIKELAEQAGSTHKQSLGVYQFYSNELEKFVELIIEECISTCERLQDDLDRQNWPTPYGCAEAIKEHFGIAKGE